MYSTLHSRNIQLYGLMFKADGTDPIPTLYSDARSDMSTRSLILAGIVY